MDKQSPRQLIVSSVAYSLSSILGPLFILGLPAYFADRFFGTKPVIFLSAVGLAFIVTNIILFRKVSKVRQEILRISPVKPDKE
ncbi:MAG: hypothetical protein ACM3PZ_01595 [Bacillota bacterium]